MSIHLVDMPTREPALCGMSRASMLVHFDQWHYLPAGDPIPGGFRDALDQRAYLDGIAQKASCPGCREAYFGRPQPTVF